MNLNLSFIKDTLMTPSCYFDQKIIMKNFEITLIANILISSLHLKQKKAILYRFSILKLVGFIIVFLQIFIARQIFTLLFRAFKLCSNVEPFHQEILNLQDIFKRNGYPGNFIDMCIKRYLNHVLIDKKIYVLAPKKELVCLLTFIRKKSLHLRSKLVKSVQNNLGFCHLKVVFQSPYKLHTLFRFKDTLDKKIRFHLVYRYSCSNCNATYYSKTQRHFFKRAAEHKGISNLTSKRVKNVKE